MKRLIVQLFNGQMMLHSREEVKEGPMLNQIEILLKPFGYMRVDQNKYCLMEEAVCYDNKSMRIFFDPEGKMSCPVSRGNKDKVIAYFDKKRQRST